MITENIHQTNKTNGADANHDAFTGTTGAQPVSAGEGSAGGATTAAAVGLVDGGLGRDGVARKINPAVEDAYWKHHYSKRKYVERNAPYTAYQPAFRIGYEGRSRYPGKHFEEAETDLQRDYDNSKGKSTLNWDKAKRATRDAWNRVEKVLAGAAVGNGR